MKFGVPEKIVSDNGSQFRSNAFQKLMKQYNIRLKRMPLSASIVLLSQPFGLM